MPHIRTRTAGIAVLCAAFFLAGFFFQEKKEQRITRGIVEQAEKIFGLTFDEAKRDSMLDNLGEQLASYEAIRGVEIPNNVPPSLGFNPLPVGFVFEKSKTPFILSPVVPRPVPRNLEDLAFASVRELGELIRTRKISSEQLTRMYLGRLKQYGPKLECVVSLTEDLALEQARRADRELAAGKYRGPLHGIPYGAKDLLATKRYRTTWGATPFKDQVIDEDATVIRKLEETGAVLVAKLTLGALAWGDVWYGGMTRNPCGRPILFCYVVHSAFCTGHLELGSGGSMPHLRR